MKLTRKSAADALANQFGMSRRQAKEQVHFLAELVLNSLRQGKSVVFHNGFTVTPVLRKTLKVAGTEREHTETHGLSIRVSENYWKK